MPKILVITYTIPNDFTAGDKLYTYHLYRTLAQYASVTVIGYKDLHGVKEYENWVQEVITVPRVHWPQFLSVLSIYPNLVFQDRTMVFKKRLRRLVRNQDYDVIICDQFRIFWAADIVNRERKRLGKVRLPTILVTHNHDALLRDKLAKNENNLLKSFVFWLDAKKTRWHENKALLSFDRVTANTTDDAKSIGAIYGQKIEVLTPGYSGQRIKDEHQITPETSKQVVVLGSYFWVAKQLNLRQLVKAAASIFPKAGVKLIVVGSGPASLQTEISRYPFVKVTGRVESFDKYLEKSRVAIIAETTGGGFKHKALDYVFGKVPMAVVKGTMAGLPLQPNIDYLEYSTVNELVEGVAQEIDNIEKLNLLASNALTACRDKFRWEDRGRALYEIVCELT